MTRLIAKHLSVNIKTIDIETAPTIAYVWKGWKENIGQEQVLRDGAILSYAVKDLGVKAVRYDSNEANTDYYDDRRIVTGLWNELDTADIVIGHNVERFDVRKINARFLAHGLPPPRPYQVIDTLLHGRRIAAFWSHRLAWVSELLTTQSKRSHKSFPGFSLWREALAGNPKAWAEMRKYNPQDTVATEAYYLRLRPYMTGHPSLPLLGDGAGCPKCGHDHLIEEGTVPARTRVYPLFRCTSCGSWSRGARSLPFPRAELVQ